MKKFFKKKFMSDRGDSQLVTLIMTVPLILMILITAIDTSIYFLNRSQLSNFARDGARTVAIFGGNGNSAQQTAIEAKYGTDRDTICQSSNMVGTTDTSGALNNDSTSVECEIMKAIANSRGLVSTTVSGVKCTPQRTTAIGQSTMCTITWTYNGIPGSVLSFIKLSDSSGKPVQQTVTGSSESEVANPTMTSR